MGLSSDDTRRREVVRDLAAGALLIGALFFPWNLYFGFRIPDSSKTVFGLLLAVTSLSLASLAVTFAGRRSQLRLGLNVPYLLLVLAFVRRFDSAAPSTCPVVSGRGDGWGSPARC